MILPRPQGIALYITDIMPEPNRASFAGFDESRTVGLDMDMYRKWLSKATCGFAYLGGSWGSGV
jgi:hypothetical protein